MRKTDLPPDQLKAAVLDYLEGRFGLDPELFSGSGFYLASKGRVYLGPQQSIPKPRIVTIGLLVARVGENIKPTTNLLQAFGRHVKKNSIALSREQTLAYARGEDISPDAGDATEGYVLLSYEGHPLGCGLLKDGTIKNMLPKAKRTELKYL